MTIHQTISTYIKHISTSINIYQTYIYIHIYTCIYQTRSNYITHISTIYQRTSTYINIYQKRTISTILLLIVHANLYVGFHNVLFFPNIPILGSPVTGRPSASRRPRGSKSEKTKKSEKVCWKWSQAMKNN